MLRLLAQVDKGLPNESVTKIVEQVGAQNCGVAGDQAFAGVDVSQIGGLAGKFGSSGSSK